MTLVVLEGATLGQRHQHYNKLLNQAIANKTQPAEIDYSKTDVENLINIDLANNNRDVNYILDVLKGDDMLYVLRAIKRSNWLIIEEQFAHIIQPHYLYSELFPYMMPKASSKFLLHIRLTLKNESRIDQFFEYLKEKDIKAAIKWLPRCSLSVIETTVARYAEQISPDIFKRLCERSSNVLEINVKAPGGKKTDQLQAAMILLRKNPEKYLDALTNYERFYSYPNFGKKPTEFVMKNCPHRFFDKFEKFVNCIDIETFVKYFKKEDIQSFILEYHDCFVFQKHISVFIKHMPTKSQFKLIQKFYLDSQNSINILPVYEWYTYGPFDETFADFKKMIPTETNPDLRNTMLMILVINARNNLTHIHSLLQYYRECHINEPFQSKIEFVNNLINETDFNLYDDEMWNILEEIFSSMEVYIESDNNVETCLMSIVVRKIILDQPVPDIVEQKLKFNSWKPFQKKLNGDQKEKLFIYLYSTLADKINKHIISNQIELAENVELLKQGLDLLKDWEKELFDFPHLINKIKDCTKIKKEKGWKTSLAVLYDIKKSWKKILFQESVTLSPSQSVCINALKHDPELLARNRDEVTALRFNNDNQMKQVLRKLRVYWPLTIASEWMSSYRERINELSFHKSVVHGLCLLQNQQEMLHFVNKYKPLETEVPSNSTDELIFGVRKNISLYMHFSRPQIKPDAILAYAKGDYVRYTQPALDAILHNIKLCDSHIFSEIWQSNTALSIRAAVFQHTHNRLCEVYTEAQIAELWEIFNFFMDNLPEGKSKRIFNTFERFTKVHPSIKRELCVKSYKLLKSLPPNAYIQKKILVMKLNMAATIVQLDSDFVEDIIKEFIDEVLLVKHYTNGHLYDVRLFVLYLSTAADENTQLQRYEKVFEPFMEKSLSLWNEIDDNRDHYIRINFENILSLICREFSAKNVKPAALYSKILTRLENALPNDTEHYNCLYNVETVENRYF